MGNSIGWECTENMYFKGFILIMWMNILRVLYYEKTIQTQYVILLGVVEVKRNKLNQVFK